MKKIATSALLALSILGGIASAAQRCQWRRVRCEDLLAATALTQLKTDIGETPLTSGASLILATRQRLPRPPRPSRSISVHQRRVPVR